MKYLIIHPKKASVPNWERYFTIAVRIEGKTVIIQADKPGLISLARHLLTLAQDQIPGGHHLHYDEFNSLEDGSSELVLEKLYTNMSNG